MDEAEKERAMEVRRAVSEMKEEIWQWRQWWKREWYKLTIGKKSAYIPGPPLKTTVVSRHTTIGKALDLGLDTDRGPWVSICHLHGTFTNFRLKRDAVRNAKECRGTAADWCEKCAEDSKKEAK